MKAAVLHEPNTPLSVEEVILDPPRAGEVRVRVAAAGVCHSDLHLVQGHLGEGRWPIVLGHEGAGVVEEVGEGVAHVAPGDHVAFCFVPACGHCRSCLGGRRNLCSTAARHSIAGHLLDGTSRLRLADGRPLQHFLTVACFAEQAVVAAASAVPIPGQLPLWQAALLGCGVVTGFGAVRHAAGVREGDSVCVIGCGGIGLQIVAAARLAGARAIVAVERDATKLELALGRGATHAVDASAEPVTRAVRDIVPGGVDHAFEAIGRPETMRLAWDVIRYGGAAVVVGIAPRGVDLAVPALDLINEKTLKGSFYGSGDPFAQLEELALLAAAGTFTLDDVVSHVTTLEGIEAGFERMRRGEGARTVAIIDAELAGRAAD